MHSFWKFWRHGFNKAFKKSWEKYGHALIAFGLIYAIGAICLSQYSNIKFLQAEMSFWVQLGVPTLLLIVFLAYHLFRAPYEIYKELYGKLKDETSSRDRHIKKLADAVHVISNSIPQLELMPAFSDKDGDGKYFCRIAVKNNSLTATARLVKVELVEITPAPRVTGYFALIHDVPYPLSLKPSEQDGHTINPCCVSKFDIFVVHRNVTKRESKSDFVQLSVSFSGRPRMFQENPEMPRFQIGGFSPELRDNNHAELGFKEYCVKIRVSAEGVPAEDKKFIVIFTEDLSQDPVQISKIGKDVLEGDNMVDLHDCEHYASFKDLPEAVCRRLLRYKTALLQGLRAVQENRK